MLKSIILFLLCCFLIVDQVAAQQLPRFYVRIVGLTAVDSDEEATMRRAIRIFEKVMNDTTFQRRLMDTSFVFDLPNDPMRNLSSKQIVDTLFSGREWYSNVSDNTADIIWICNQRKKRPLFSNTIGYGNENDSLINTYRWVMRTYKVENIVGNLAHEWSHKVGFDHQDDSHPERSKTVPYLFGNLVVIFAKKHLNDN